MKWYFSSDRATKAGWGNKGGPGNRKGWHDTLKQQDNARQVVRQQHNREKQRESQRRRQPEAIRRRLSNSKGGRADAQKGRNQYTSVHEKPANQAGRRRTIRHRGKRMSRIYRDRQKHSWMLQECTHSGRQTAKKQKRFKHQERQNIN